jgi:hypothetical protein
MKFSDSCPDCGFKAQQEFDLCPKCGVIIEKYYAKQLEREQRESEKKKEQITQAESTKITKNYKISSNFNFITTTTSLLIVYSIIVEFGILNNPRRNYNEAYGIEFLCPIIILILMIPMLIGFKLKVMTSKYIKYILLAIALVIEFIAYIMISFFSRY